jgi:pimeloyl-ACP methyl ester carboxylesterase
MNRPQAVLRDSGGDRTVKHRTIEIDRCRVFYREAGAEDAPVILMPHGYPCSSYAYRNFMPALADRWRLIAPDFPGFGHSDTPSSFAYDFDGYARFLGNFVEKLDLRRFALYLHDYGSQIGLRLATANPGRIAALVIQNGDIYEDALGPKYAALKDFFAAPTSAKRQKLVEALSEEGFKDEFLNDLREELRDRISPDLWKLHWPLMNTPERRELSLKLMEGLKQNLEWFPRYQAYLREHQPPTLIVWGPNDGYMPEASARAYLRDIPKAELVLTDGGHWLLETHLEQVVPVIRRFLSATRSR